VTFFLPLEPGEARRPRRPTLRAPEETARAEAWWRRYDRATRLRAAAGIYVKVLLLVAIGCFALMAYITVLNADGRGRSGLFSVCLLGACALRSVSSASRLSRATGTGPWLLRAAILPNGRGTRVRFFIYETALLLALLLGAGILGR
jgi:hypothetical protein